MPVHFSEEEIIQATGATRLLGAGRSAYEAVCTDTRSLTPGCLFVALVGERFDAHTFLDKAVAGGAAGAIVQEGKARPATPEGFALFEVKDTLVALGGLARFHRARFKLPVGAITGSK